MPSQNETILHQNQPIRTAWDEQAQEWCFSVVDVIKIVTKQPDQRRAGKYWSVLKLRLSKEGAQLSTLCSQLKMTASDGRKRSTDVANLRQLLRIIQVIPSPHAEPFKLWLAQLGQERILSTIDPERSIASAVETYFRKGYDRLWIEERLRSIQVRAQCLLPLSPQSLERGVELGILADEMASRTTMPKKESIRDQMSVLEVVMMMLESR